MEYGLDSSRANKFGHTACYYADFSNHRHCAGYLAMVDTCLLLAKQLVLTAQAQQGWVLQPRAFALTLSSLNLP